mmetsp:Transcript_101547/g.287733  ORF Transcript_101547/g.287733 Transcript_101547/m.287733 type:complete len:320 (+) Transcript_101547:98-1057(+)
MTDSSFHQGKKGGVSLHGSEENSGSRFSRKDLTPSLPSGLFQLMHIDSFRCADSGVESSENPRWMRWRFSMVLMGETSSRERASSIASGITRSRGTTRVKSPQCSSSFTVKTRPVSTKSFAFVSPTRRGRKKEEQPSMVSPRLPNTKPILASSAAMRKSIGVVRVAPMPTAGPLMAAMHGFSDRAMARLAWPPPSRAYWICPRRPGATSPGMTPPPGMPFRSMPAQKLLPSGLPVKTRTRTFGSRFAVSTASMISLRITSVHAFLCFGRLSWMTSILPSSLVWMCCHPMPAQSLSAPPGSIAATWPPRGGSGTQSRRSA